MKIIHLLVDNTEDPQSEVRQVVEALATQQQRVGADVAVWTITPDSDAAYPAREFATRLFAAKRSPFGMAQELSAALRELAGTAAVVHLHGAFVPVYFRVARRLAAVGVPYVLTPHGSYSPAAMSKNRLAKLVYGRVFERYLLRRAARVHCLGQSEVASAEKLYAQLPTSLLPYGFEVPWPQKPTTFTASDRFRVGFCGRLDDQHKGLECLLAGFAAFARQVPEAELWIIGDGPDRAQVDYWAEDAPTGSIQLLGRRYGDEKIGLLSQLHVFAHTSHYESLPAAVLEAVALGVPCVVTEATNLGQYVREFRCGEVLPTADPHLFTQSLHRLHRHWLAVSDSDTLSARCRQMVSTAFHWPLLLPAYEQMYRQTLAA